MLAMHYKFSLPRAFDMGQIRARVAEKGPAFDHLPGLRQKAFLINDAASFGAGRGRGNEYAAFYVWDSADAARDFILGEKFAAVVDSFGRPVVHTWLVTAATFAAAGGKPAFALSERLPVPGDAALERIVEVERTEGERIGRRTGLHSWISAVDPERWEGLRFSLWSEAAAAEIPASGNLQAWDVLHLSAPGDVALSPQAAA